MATVTPGLGEVSPGVSQSHGGANTSQQSFHQGARGSSTGCSAQSLDPTPFLVSLVPGVGLVPGLCPHTSTAHHLAWGLVAFAEGGLGCVPGGFMVRDVNGWGGQAQGPAALGPDGAFAGATRLGGLTWVGWDAHHPPTPSLVGEALPWLCLSSPGLWSGGPAAAQAAPLLPAPSWQPPLPPACHCGLNLPLQRLAGQTEGPRAAQQNTL